jgi:hypothetical protein
MNLSDLGLEGKDLNDKRGFHYVDPRVEDYDSGDIHCKLIESLLTEDELAETFPNERACKDTRYVYLGHNDNIKGIESFSAEMIEKVREQGLLGYDYKAVRTVVSDGGDSEYEELTECYDTVVELEFVARDYKTMTAVAYYQRVWTEQLRQRECDLKNYETYLECVKMFGIGE